MELILIRGLPGSGKSTLAKAFGANYMHVETDTYFMVGSQYEFNVKELPQAHDWCQRTAAFYLSDIKAGRNGAHGVIVSNTFSQLWEMKPYIEMAKYFGADLLVIEAAGNFKNVHGVPDAVIEKMKARWEKYVP